MIRILSAALLTLGLLALLALLIGLLWVAMQIPAWVAISITVVLTFFASLALVDKSMGQS